MKKLFFIILIYITSLNTVLASESINVSFSKCVDGDTAKFIYNNEIITARFLAIDTPETKHPTKGIQPYGKEASTYTCNKIKQAKEIRLEYDDNSDKLDKYNRHLVWIFIDSKLLQKDLVSNGLAKVAYLYGDYKYTNELKKSENYAKEKNIGIWSTNNSINIYPYIVIATILIILCLFNKKFKNKTKRKLINKIKKELK